MAIKRTIRISLDQYEPTWSECFVILSMMSYRELDNYLNPIIDKTNEIQRDDTLTLLKSIQGRFVSGLIFDHDLNAKREMTVEDILDFDINILGEWLGIIMGNDKKK